MIKISLITKSLV